MNLIEYQVNALRTESIVDKAIASPELLLATMKLFTQTSEILDALKKSIYYGDDSKLEKLNDLKLVGDMANQIETITETIEMNEHLEDKQSINIDSRVLHATIGISTEAGELVEAIEHVLLTGDELDIVNVSEELVDACWYMTIMFDELDLSWEKGLQQNIEKLTIRFPDKFTQKHAAYRDLLAERKALANMVVDV